MGISTNNLGVHWLRNLAYESRFFASLPMAYDNSGFTDHGDCDNFLVHFSGFFYERVVLPCSSADKGKLNRCREQTSQKKPGEMPAYACYVPSDVHTTRMMEALTDIKYGYSLFLPISRHPRFFACQSAADNHLVAWLLEP